MIKGHVSDLGNAGVHPLIEQSLTLCQTYRKEDFPLERKDIDDHGLFLNFACGDTALEQERCSEAHVAYVDIHYVVSGTERIDVGSVADMTVAQAYNEEQDIAFYEGEHHTSSILKEGEFMVCFPEDVHRVMVAPTTPAPICKVIVKIPMDRF